MHYNPSQLVLIPFPYSDLRATKQRPVLVLTKPDRHKDFIGLAVTSIPTREFAIPLDAGSLIHGSLPKASWVRLNKIFTLESSQILKVFGQIHPELYQRILEGICQQIGFVHSPPQTF